MEQENVKPTLTLEPDSLMEASSAFREITLEEAKKNAPVPTAEEVKEIIPAVLDDTLLTEDEKKQVEEFASKIDIKNTQQVIQYGSAAQKSVADFSQNALEHVKTRDLGEIGESLTNLVVEIKNASEPEKKGLAGLFQKKKNDFEAMKASYSKAETNVDRIVTTLEKHEVVLMKDIALFDKLYDLNLNYYKELTMYILAGKKALENARNTELADLKKKAEETGTQEDAQGYNDFASMCDRFEKKLHDLELTRIISVQMGPQTRLLQNNDMLMLEKIQSSLINTIPLWKSQLVLALGISHSAQATKAQNEVTEMTNELLKKNAETLKMSTIETAKEAERSIVDIETLKETNTKLIETLDEVINIHEEGRTKRAEAEVELAKIEGELKAKLLEMRG
jgi:uncharacterized protein YaaN involved in tellurite resistance